MTDHYQLSFNKRSMALSVIFMLFLLFGEALSLSGQLVNFHSSNSNEHANRAKQDYTNWKALTIIAGTYDKSDSTIAAFVYMESFTINDVLNYHNREQFHRSVKHRLENSVGQTKNSQGTRFVTHNYTPALLY